MRKAKTAITTSRYGKGSLVGAAVLLPAPSASLPANFADWDVTDVLELADLRAAMLPVLSAIGSNSTLSVVAAVVSTTAKPPISQAPAKENNRP